MNAATIVEGLTEGGKVPEALARELVAHFLALRADAATGSLGRSSPGLFVEAYTECLEALAAKSGDPRAKVDARLRTLESNTSLDDGLRLCGTRVAMAAYALRSHRSIVHRGTV